MGCVVVTKSRLPVSVGLRTGDELVMRMILYTEAELADCDIGADYALKFAFVHKRSFA